MRCWLSTLAVAVVAAGGCGGLDRHIEDQITIEQGIYGLLISGCDTDGCRDGRAGTGDCVVQVAAGAAFLARWADEGVYGIALPPGDYELCTSSCTPVTVPAGTIRYDWTSGPGGGHWEPQP